MAEVLPLVQTARFEVVKHIKQLPKVKVRVVYLFEAKSKDISSKYAFIIISHDLMFNVNLTVCPESQFWPDIYFETFSRNAFI